MSIEPDSFSNRELSWLGFARRVLSLVERPEVPLLERVKFAGIMGMLHDEFFMKRVSGLKRQVKKGSEKLSLGGLTPEQELVACRAELVSQAGVLDRLVQEELRPALRRVGLPLLDHAELPPDASAALPAHFVEYVLPIPTPLAVDAEHPFPFISSGTLNLAVLVPVGERGKPRFVRIKVPDNRPRWVALPGGAGFVPLEQVIAANLDLLFPTSPPAEVYTFRVTRGAEGEADPIEQATDAGEVEEPGRILRIVANELKARRFAGVVRLQVSPEMPDRLAGWLCQRLDIAA